MTTHSDATLALDLIQSTRDNPLRQLHHVIGFTEGRPVVRLWIEDLSDAGLYQPHGTEVASAMFALDGEPITGQVDDLNENGRAFLSVGGDAAYETAFLTALAQTVERLADAKEDG